MKINGKIIILLASILAMIILWQSDAAKEDKFSVMLLISVIILLTTGDLIFSRRKRGGFKRTYQTFDEYQYGRRFRPKPLTLIILSVIGIVVSLLLKIPVLPYIFGGLLLISLFYAAMME
jgi:hypothetical protein